MVKKLELEKQKKLADEYLDDLKRIQADFENFAKRVEKEQEEARKYSNAGVLLELVKLREDFERALSEKQDNKGFLEGIEMIYKNLNEVLKSNGVSEISAKNEKLDPFKHEVLSFREGEEDNVIVEEVQKGFMIHDRVLRHSKVIVTKSGGKQNE
jgi:molecular chaperone GrpE